MILSVIKRNLYTSICHPVLSPANIKYCNYRLPLMLYADNETYACYDNVIFKKTFCNIAYFYICGCFNPWDEHRYLFHLYSSFTFISVLYCHVRQSTCIKTNKVPALYIARRKIKHIKQNESHRIIDLLSKTKKPAVNEAKRLVQFWRWW